MRIVAVIPAFNESDRIIAAVNDAKQFVDYVVVVDDCSSDDTGAIARSAGAIVLRHSMNRGQGAALQTGTDYALQKLVSDVIVHFDADGQMRGDEIPSMIAPIARGEADIVLGSRFLGKDVLNMPIIRKIMVRLGVVFTILLSGIRVTDTHNGFRALSRKAATDMRITLDRMAHASEILDLIATKRLRYVECPVTISYSNETLKKGQTTLSAMLTAKEIIKKKISG